MRQLLSRGYPSKLTLEDCSINAICKAANRGDLLASEVIEHVGRYLGKAVAIAINLFNPQKVVIAGEITEADKVLLPAIQSCINTRVLKDFRKNLPVVTSELNHRSAIGAFAPPNARCSTACSCSDCWKADPPLLAGVLSSPLACRNHEKQRQMKIKNVICDIDGVLLHDNTPVPGADLFPARIREQGMPLVVLTNYPSQTAQDLANRFAAAGLEVPESAFYTSAMATADFLRRREGKSLRGRRRRPDP